MMAVMERQELDSVWREFDARRDAAAFEALYEAARPLVAAMVWRAVREPEATEEVVAAVFARLWLDRERRPKPGVTPKQAFVRWALDEARTANRRRWRERGRERGLEAAAMVADSNASVREVVERQLTAERVRALIATLPEKYREALLACEVEGLSPEEAGRALGRPAETVKTQSRRGRDLLARKLKATGLTLPAASALVALGDGAPAAGQPISAGEIIARAESLVASAGPIAAGGAAVTAKAGLIAAAALVLLLLLGGVLLTDSGRNWLAAVSGGGNTPGGVVASVNSFNGTSDASGNSAAEEAADSIMNESVDINAASSNNNSIDEPVQENSAGEDAAAAGDEEEGNLLIYGTVLDKVTKAAIAGVEVGVYSDEDKDLEATLAQLPSPKAKTLTDDAGNYRVRVHSRALEQQQGIAVSAKPSSENTRQIAIVFPLPMENQNERRLDFFLPRAEAISGTVVDEQGQAIAGAQVGHFMVGELDLSNAMQSGAITATTAVTLSESDGYFRLEGLEAGKSIELPVKADGFAPMMTEPIAAGAKDVRIVLQRGSGTVIGRAVKSEKPVADVTVTMRPIEPSRAQDFVWQNAMTRSAKTNENGEFEFSTVQAGNYVLSASQAVSGTTSLGHVSEEVVISGEERKDVVLRFAADARIDGVAVDAETGNPLAGVRISTKPFYSVNLEDDYIELPETDREESVTGADGKFEISVPVGGGQNSVMFHYKQPEGYMASNDVWARSNSINLSQVQPGATQKVELKLPRGAKLRGRVVNESGDFVPGARVQQRPDFDMSVRTDHEGRFEMDVYRACKVELTASQGPLVAKNIVEVDKDGSAPEVEMVLSRGSRISGRVYEESGKPATARVQTKQPLPNGYRMGTMAMTNETGFYDLGYFPSGKLSVAVFGLGGSEVASRAVELEAGVDSVQDFHLGEGHYLDGVVTDEAFTPLAGANIWASQRSTNGEYLGGQIMATTDKDGYYRLKGLQEGSVLQVSISHSKYQSESKSEVALTGEPLNIVMKLKKRLVVRIVDTNGAPVTRFQYRVMNMESSSLESPSATAVDSATGEFVLEKLEDRHYRIDAAEVNAAGIATGRKGVGAFNLRTDPIESFVITVGGTYPVRGKVRMYGGDEPIEGAKVTLRRPMIHGQGQANNAAFDPNEAVTDANGQFAIMNVPIGVHEFEVQKDGMAKLQQQGATVYPDGTSDEIIIKMARTGQ